MGGKSRWEIGQKIGTDRESQIFEGPMVRVQYCSEWTEFRLWYGTLILGFEMTDQGWTDEGTTSIVCGFSNQEGQGPELCEFITLLKY